MDWIKTSQWSRRVCWRFGSNCPSAGFLDKGSRCWVKSHAPPSWCCWKAHFSQEEQLHVFCFSGCCSHRRVGGKRGNSCFAVLLLPRRAALTGSVSAQGSGSGGAEMGKLSFDAIGWAASCLHIGWELARCTVKQGTVNWDEREESVFFYVGWKKQSRFRKQFDLSLLGGRCWGKGIFLSIFVIGNWKGLWEQDIWTVVQNYPLSTVDIESKAGWKQCDLNLLEAVYQDIGEQELIWKGLWEQDTWWRWNWVNENANICE